MTEEKEVMMEDPKMQTPITSNQRTIAKGAVLKKLRATDSIYQMEGGVFNLVIKGRIVDENSEVKTILNQFSVMANYPMDINITRSHGAGIQERIYQGPSLQDL